MPDGWVFNANYKLTSVIPSDPYSWQDGSGIDRLDLTISKQILKGNGEIMFGVSDVLNKTTSIYKKSSGLTAHELPGRTIFTRL
jgi:hypothetical protein